MPPLSFPAGQSTPVHEHQHDAALVLDAAQVMGRPDRVVAGPQGNDGQFVVECEFSHSAPDDPIVFPEQPGRSHLHAFFGNVSTSAMSRFDDLLGSGTTCDDERDTAAYWVPVLVDAGRIIEPEFAVAYYRAGIDVAPNTVRAYPPGLVMVAGDPTAEEAQPIETVSWSCGPGSHRVASPTTCPPGAPLRLSVTFPDCWDGVHLDIAGHRRHMHYSSGGRCPKSHPVPVAQLTFAVTYPVTGDVSTLRLASGGMESGHADFVNAWDQMRLEHEVDLCIRQQNVCRVWSGRRPA